MFTKQQKNIALIAGFVLLALAVISSFSGYFNLGNRIPAPTGQPSIADQSDRELLKGLERAATDLDAEYNFGTEPKADEFEVPTLD